MRVTWMPLLVRVVVGFVVDGVVGGVFFFVALCRRRGEKEGGGGDKYRL